MVRSTSSLLHHLVRVINPSIYAKLPYDTEKDFAPISMVASAAILMAVNPSVPADTVRGLIEGRQDPPADDRELRICGLPGPYSTSPASYSNSWPACSCSMCPIAGAHRQ